MGTAEHDRFADELQSLKQLGCSILVVGPPGENARCSDLLGDDDRDRKRIVVATDRDDAPVSDDGLVIDGGGTTVRSASSAAPQPTETGSEPPLDSIATEIRDAVSAVGAGGLGPGQLRVCCGDLETLAARDDGDVVPYVERVTELVSEQAGMSHAHLPATSPLRDSLESMFDVTVEVRSTPEGRQQRWLLHDADLDSGWLAIES